MESSAKDLAAYGLAVLDSKLLDPQLTDFMFQDQTVNGLDTKHGLGWALTATGQPSHSGAQQGCRTNMLLDRETGTVFVVMTNTDGNHPIGTLLEDVMKAWKGTPVELSQWTGLTHKASRGATSFGLSISAAM